MSKVAGRTWRFLVHSLPWRELNPNRVRGAHFSAPQRASAALAQDVMRYFQAEHLPPPAPLQHARIRVEYRRSLARPPAGDPYYRPLDIQNAMYAIKPAIDALTRPVPATLRRAGRVGVGLIEDDDWRCLEELTVKLVAVDRFDREGLHFTVTELVERV